MPSPKAKPFNKISADIFKVNKINYLTIICQHSEWLCVFPIEKDDPLQVIFIFRRYFHNMGLRAPCSQTKALSSPSNRWMIFFSLMTLDMNTHHICIIYKYTKALSSPVNRWMIFFSLMTLDMTTHHICPSDRQVQPTAQANRTKAGQRLVLTNLSDDNSLSQDRLEHALFLHRNTPDPIDGLSPAEVVYGIKLQGYSPLEPNKHKFVSPQKPLSMVPDFLF